MTEKPPSVDELAEFKAWKAERDERKRTNGAYCLTPEGREEVLSIFGNDPDSWVWALFTRVEELEAALASPDMEQRAGFVMVPVAQVVHEKFKDSLGGQHERRKVVLFKEGLDLPDGTLLAAAPPIEALEGGKTDLGAGS